MKQKSKQLSWKVKIYDCNANAIKDYDILKYRDELVRKLKKICVTKAQFSEMLNSELKYRYWSRAEYELIISIDETGHIWLSPWCGCRNPEEVKIDVTDDASFDWEGFAVEHIGKQIFDNKAKVDIYDQLTYNNQFKKLVDYCWYTRLKYERDNLKFHK